MVYNRIPVTFNQLRQITAPYINYQYDVVQILVINGLELPDYYTVDFCNVGDTEAIPITGTSDGVRIPDELLLTGRDIKAYIILTGIDSGAVETRYEVTIPVRNRPMRSGVTPTPEERLEIETLVNALNDGVTRAEDAATEAESQADRAETAAENAQSAVEHYPKIEDGYWYVWLNGVWVNTGVKAEGVDGKGIASVTGQKTSTSGLVDTYALTVTYTDSTTDTITFTVTNGRDGVDGYSPTATVTKSGNTATITITDKNGTTTATVTDGTDGVSPGVTITDITGGHRVTITDKYHPTGQSFDVMDGEVSAADLKAVADSKAPVIIDTASGAIASFSDGADAMPIKALTVSIEPQQDLHGQANPYPAGGGKNLVSDETVSASTLGCSSVFANGMMTITGTATANGGRTVLKTGFFHLDAGTYYFKKFNASGSPAPDAYIQVGNTSITSNTGQFSLEEAKDNVNIGFNVINGITYNYSVKLLISKTDDTEWTPYSNICPISGWTGCEVNRTGKNLLPTQIITKNGSTYLVGDENTWFPFKAGTYTASNAGTASYMYWRKKGTSDNNVIHNGSTRSGTFILAEDCEIRFWFYTIDASPSFTDIQIELGTTASPYEEFTGETIPISWQTEAGTVYGGTLELTTGVLTVDRKSFDMGTATWSMQASTGTNNPRFVTTAIASDARGNSQPQGNISSILTEDGDPIYSRERDNCFIVASNGNIYAECTQYQDAASFKSAMNGQTIVYYLATPITVQLDPVTVSTLLGENNIWHDANGDVSVDYCADTKLYLEKLTQPTEDDMIANANIAANKFFMIGNTLYYSTAAIAQGATIVPGTNCTKVSLADALNTLNA